MKNKFPKAVIIDDKSSDDVVTFRKAELLAVPEFGLVDIGSGYIGRFADGNNLKGKGIFVSPKLIPHIVTDSGGDTVIVFTAAEGK